MARVNGWGGVFISPTNYRALNRVFSLREKTKRQRQVDDRVRLYIITYAIPLYDILTTEECI